MTERTLEENRFESKKIKTHYILTVISILALRKNPDVQLNVVFLKLFILAY